MNRSKKILNLALENLEVDFVGVRIVNNSCSTNKVVVVNDNLKNESNNIDKFVSMTVLQPILTYDDKSEVNVVNSPTTSNLEICSIAKNHDILLPTETIAQEFTCINQFEPAFSGDDTAELGNCDSFNIYNSDNINFFENEKELESLNLDNDDNFPITTLADTNYYSNNLSTNNNDSSDDESLSEHSEFNKISDSEDDFRENLNPNVTNLENTRKRKKTADKASWIRENNKQKRMRGEKYLGFSTRKNEKMKQNVERSERKLKPTCKSEFCKKSKVRHCLNISEAQRENMFKFFWTKMSWDQRKIFVSANVEKNVVKRKTTANDHESRRQGTFMYYLNVNDQKLQVCRTMFLNTFDLGYKTVQEWVNNGNSGMHQSSEQKATVKQALKIRTTSNIENIDKFLNELPKLPSHYARKTSSKLFLEPIFKNNIDVFNLYKTYCNDNNLQPLTKKYFYKRFQEKNLSIYTLKKDQCNVCSSYNTGNLSEPNYINHRNRKDRARLEKEVDKQRALKDECITICVDLQAVKLSPYLQAGAFYYKTKLCVHNFTVYNLKTHDATCYWFSEDQNNELKASTFVSCLLDYLEKKCIPTKVPIIIYSDGCTYQNRNNIMSNALLNFSLKHKVQIFQKYLEPGHTYMECDSVHATIERKLKNREIYLPSDYLAITKEARQNPRPYEAIDLNYSFFLNFSLSEHLRYSSIRPGKLKDDPTVTDIKTIKYDNGKIQVKIDYDAEWQDLPVRPKTMAVITAYPRLHNQRCKISAAKFKHLQELKMVLPQAVHNFYDLLPH